MNRRAFLLGTLAGGAVAAMPMAAAALGSAGETWSLIKVHVQQVGDRWTITQVLREPIFGIEKCLTNTGWEELINVGTDLPVEVSIASETHAIVFPKALVIDGMIVRADDEIVLVPPSQDSSEQFEIFFEGEFA